MATVGSLRHPSSVGHWGKKPDDSERSDMALRGLYIFAPLEASHLERPQTALTPTNPIVLLTTLEVRWRAGQHLLIGKKSVTRGGGSDAGQNQGLTYGLDAVCVPKSLVMLARQPNKEVK